MAINLDQDLSIELDELIKSEKKDALSGKTTESTLKIKFADDFREKSSLRCKRKKRKQKQKQRQNKERMHQEQAAQNRKTLKYAKEMRNREELKKAGLGLQTTALATATIEDDELIMAALFPDSRFDNLIYGEMPSDIEDIFEDMFEDMD